MDIEIIPFIVLISYLGGELLKMVIKNKKGLNKIKELMPHIIGLITAIVIYLDEPEYLKVKNIYVAMEIGIISGASATSTNQIIKKIFYKKKEEEK